MTVSRRPSLPSSVASRWADLSLRGKGMVVVAIPVIALLVVSAAFYLAVRMGEKAAAAEEDAVEARAAARDMVVTVLQAEVDLRGFLLTKEGAFNPYQRAAEEIDLELDRLKRALEDDTEQEGRLTLVETMTERLLGVLGQFRGQAAPELEEYLLFRGQDTIDALRGVLEAVVEQEDEDVSAARERADSAGRISRTVAAVSLPFGLLGGLGAVFLFTSSVVRRIQLLETNSARLGFRQRLEAFPAGGDEVGRLGLALRNAHDELEARSLALERTNAELQQLQAELKRQALRDELTDLYNRRGFVTLAEHQLRVATRMGHQACVLFVDLDGMKRINDVHGHSEGDRALVETADLLRQTLRKSDLVARLGGDEFCAVLVDCSDKSEKAVLERLEQAIEARNERGDLPYRLALSVGSARFDPRTPRPIDELLEEADRYMYRQKAARLSS